MGFANVTITTRNEYQQILNQHPLVIALFTAQTCQACMGLSSRFNRFAETYAGRVKSLLLDTAQIEQIDGVSGTPTFVIYRNAQEVDNIKGIVDPDEQDDYLDKFFTHYANGNPAPFTYEPPPAPTAPASPAAHPPLPR